MPTRYLDYIQPKSRWARWAWGPVIVLRVALVATYVICVYAGIIGIIAGVPILDLTTLPGYTSVWAALLALSAAVAAVGSISDRLQKLELGATMVLSAMLLAYIGGLNISAWVEYEIGRQFVGAIAAVVGILPFTRFVYLAAQSGKIHVGTKSNE